ncbi:hypothetical protein Lumi_017 [Xylophilus phage Lumi]|nr:hypothetical protein Lumi_017 [Xylophilus phage Lumi]
MPGEARSDNFLLSTATLMLGPQASLLALNPDAHSLGLVKDIVFGSETAWAELNQGIANSLVYSLMTGNNLNIAGDMYEFGPRQLAYGASLDGQAYTPSTYSSTVATAYAAPADPAILGAAALVLTDVTGISAGKFINVRALGQDTIHPRKVLAVDVASKTVTMNAGLPVAVAQGAKVTGAVMLPMGAPDANAFYSAKLVGQLANGKPIAILVPKVRITSGVSLAFKTDNFQGMPIAIKAFDLLPTDPFYADFATLGQNGGPAKAQVIL